MARDASREEIALAWRRRAREAHPDARHGDAGAPARFRALAEAWAVPGGPGRRASYNRGLAPRPGARDEEDLRLVLLAELVLRHRGRR